MVTDFSSSVTETEMREFFERLISTVVNLSSQAKELEVLKADHGQTVRDLEAVRHTLSVVDGKLSETNTLVDRYHRENADLQDVNTVARKERDEAVQARQAQGDTIRFLEQRNDERAKTIDSLTETVQARNARIQELEALLNKQEGDITRVTDLYHDATNENIRHRETISRLEREAQDWTKLASDHEAEAKQAKDKLASIMAVLGHTVPTSETVKAQEPVAMLDWRPSQAAG